MFPFLTDLLTSIDFSIFLFLLYSCFLTLLSSFTTLQTILYLLVQWGDFSDTIICFPSLLLTQSGEPRSMKGNCAMYLEDHKLPIGMKMMDMLFYSMYYVLALDPVSSVFSYKVFPKHSKLVWDLSYQLV